MKKSINGCLPGLYKLALPAMLILSSCVEQALSAPRDKDHFFLQPKDKIVWLGDSITAEGRYPAFFLMDTFRLYPELGTGEGKIVSVNKGISGDTAGGGLKRIGDILTAEKPAIVVVCFGMNHRGGKDPNYAKTSEEIVKKIQMAGAIPVLLTSPPVSSIKDPSRQPMVENLRGYAEDLKKIAGEEKILCVDCFNPLLKYEQDSKKDFTWGDGVHPNAEGHYVMATALKEALGYGKPLAGGKPPEKIVFYDGDDFVGGKSWARSSDGKGKTGLARSEKDAHAGKACLEWSCSDAKGMSGAWNLYEWSPNNGGLDTTPFKSFSMWVKAAGDTKPDAVKVYLDCSFTKTLPLNYAVRQTPRLDVTKYCKEALDGNWHEVVIPVGDFIPEKCEWDPATFWEIGIEAPCANGGAFSVFVDDICFKDRAKGK